MVHFHVLFMRMFTVGQSRRISEANNRELQAQYCQIQQVSGNPRRGRFTVRIRERVQISVRNPILGNGPD